MVSLHPGNIVHKLIQILNCRLRRIRIGTDLDKSQIVKGQIREAVQAREAEIPSGIDVRIAVVAETKFVRQVGRKFMEPSSREEMVSVRNRQPECPQIR